MVQGLKRAVGFIRRKKQTPELNEMKNNEIVIERCMECIFTINALFYLRNTAFYKVRAVYSYLYNITFYKKL